MAAQLTERQLLVLEWIKQGCPEAATPEGNYKISARTLEGHELVKIKGHGAAWKATITERGKRVLTGDEPLRRTKVKKRGEVTASTTGAPTSTTKPQPAVKPRQMTPYQPRVMPTEAETDTLLDAVAGARNGFFRVKCSKDEYERQWEPRLKAAAQHVVAKDSTRRLVFQFKDKPWRDTWPSHAVAGFVDDVAFTQQSIDIAAGRKRPGKFHPMVAHFSPDGKNCKVSKAAMPRVKRLLHVLFVEAERMGWTVKHEPDTRGVPYYHRKEGFVYLANEDRVSEIKVIEQHDSFQREPTKKEIEDHNRYSWDSDRPMKKLYDRVPNGRLSIEIGWSKINDTKRKPTRLDEVLPKPFTQMKQSCFFAQAEADLSKQVDQSWDRRVDKAADIVRVRVGRRHELEQLKRHAREYKEYQQLVTYVETIRGDGSATSEYVSWCWEVLRREDPVSNVEVPLLPRFDRSEHREEIVRVAQTLPDPEFGAWNAMSFGEESSGENGEE